MTETARTVIVIDSAESRFQPRAGALIRASEHILIHRAVGETFWSSPGGRVEFHEAGAEGIRHFVRQDAV